MTDRPKLSIQNSKHENPNLKKSKNFISKEDYEKTLQLLITQFPNTFSDKQPKILKIRIHKDLKEQTNLSSNIIKTFFRKYCRTKRYIAALVENAPRYDLEGKVVDHVKEQTTVVDQSTIKG